MGLCKCERKKVTNLFCFEHRVNVCEFCLISNHPRCIVKSYLLWLKDSDFSAVCSLCSKSLNGDDVNECVRLMCLDVFHWQCLNKCASELPSTTTTAGYECPSCSQCIIPLPNQGGPLAEALRTKLETASWMKPNWHVKPYSNKPKTKPQAFTPPLTDFNEGKLLDPSLDAYATKFLRGDDTAVYMKPTPSNPSSTILTVSEHTDANVAMTALSDPSSVSSPSITRYERQRHLNEETDSQAFVPPSSPQMITADGEDEDKYRRRVPSRTIGQALGLPRVLPTINPFKIRRYRFCGFVGLVALVFLSIIFLLHSFNDTNGREDPLLDPMLNPEIHVARESAPTKL